MFVLRNQSKFLVKLLRFPKNLFFKRSFEFVLSKQKLLFLYLIIFYYMRKKLVLFLFLQIKCICILHYIDEKSFRTFYFNFFFTVFIQNCRWRAFGKAHAMFYRQSVRDSSKVIIILVFLCTLFTIKLSVKRILSKILLKFLAFC